MLLKWALLKIQPHQQLHVNISALYAMSVLMLDDACLVLDDACMMLDDAMLACLLTVYCYALTGGRESVSHGASRRALQSGRRLSSG